MSISLAMLEGLVRLRDEMTPSLRALQKTASDVSKSINKDLGAEGIEKIGKALTENIGGKTAAAVAAGGAAIAAGLAYATHSMLELADQTSNLSASTGIGVESLQKLSFVGSAVGIDMEQIAQSMNKFQRGLVEGSERVVDGLSKLGLSRETLANMLPEDQLQAVLTALNDKIPNAANRTAVAMDLLGRSGAKLLPLGQGMAALMERAEAVKISMSDIGAADQLGDQIGFLGKTFDLLVNSIGAAITSNESLKMLVVGLQDIFIGLAETVHNNRAEMSDLVSNGVEFVTAGLINMVEAVKVAGEAWNALRIVWLSAKNVGGELALVQLQMRLAAAVENRGVMNENGTMGQKDLEKDLQKQIDMVMEWKAQQADAALGIQDSTTKWDAALSKIGKSMETLSTKIKGAHGKVVEFSGATDHSKVTLEQAAAAAKAAGDASDKWWKSMEDADAATQKAEAATKSWWDSIKGMSADEVTDAVFKIGKQIEETGGLSGKSASEIAKISAELQRLKSISPEGFSAAAKAFNGTIEAASVDILKHDMGNIAAQVMPSLKPGMSQIGKEAGGFFAGEFGKALSGLSGVILSAIQGGGNVGKSIGASLGGALGADLGASLAKSIGGSLGKALGGLAGPLGSIAGSILGGLGDKLFGKIFKSEQKKVNDLRDSFFDAQGGFVELQKKLKEATSQDLVKKIFNAKTVKEFEAAVKEAQAALDLHAEANEKLQAAIDKYGFSIEELGPKFQQQELDKQAAALIQDYQLLTASGIDATMVMQKMGPAFVDFVNTAKKTGLALPETMRPMIEQLIASGQLLDENGNAFTSVEAAGLSFTETLTEGLSRMIESINQLVAALTGVGTAAGNIHLPQIPGGGDTGAGPGGKYESYAVGTSYVPQTGLAMLHKGEKVIPAGGNGGGNVITIEVIMGDIMIPPGAGLDPGQVASALDVVVRNNMNQTVDRLKEKLRL